MEGLEETIVQNDKDLHPIQSFFGGAWDDTKVGIRTAINAYRRCGS